MPFFFFIFWGMIAAFFISGLAVSGFAWIWALKRKVPVLQWAAGLVFCGLCLVVLSGGVTFAVSLWRGSQPRYVFEEAFHQKPPAGVTVLHGRSSGFIDSAAISVAFRTDRATFDRLRPASLSPITLERYRNFSSQRPAWWREPGPDTAIWLSDVRQVDGTVPRSETHGFATEWTFMTWDADGLGQFDWSGID
jgi:hypothetical protein